jgi:hypothetical protein
MIYRFVGKLCFMFRSVFSIILIIALAFMLACKGGKSPADQKRMAGFEEFFDAFFTLKSSTELDMSLSKLIHPTVGIYFIHRPGSVSEVRWFNTWQSVLATNEMNQLLVMLNCKPQLSELPEFDCLNEFNKKGCFYQNVQAQTWVWSKLKRLKSNYIMEISDREATTAQKTDSLTSVMMIITDAYVRMHFGKIEGKWYLLLIDHEDFDCSL